MPKNDASRHRAPMRGAEQIQQYCLAGNATITLLSQKTGQRFTYRFRKKEQTSGNPVWFIGLLAGPDNQSSYKYIGYVAGPQHRLQWSRKSCAGQDAPSWRALLWFWRSITETAAIPPMLEVWHEGKCGRCGRALTVPLSIERGIGPECWEIIGGAIEPARMAAE